MRLNIFTATRWSYLVLSVDLATSCLNLAVCDLLIIESIYCMKLRFMVVFFTFRLRISSPGIERGQLSRHLDRCYWRFSKWLVKGVSILHLFGMNLVAMFMIKRKKLAFITEYLGQQQSDSVKVVTLCAHFLTCYALDTFFFVLRVLLRRCSEEYWRFLVNKINSVHVM